MASVTFLTTDVEGSTRRWEDDPDRTRDAIALHDRIGADEIVRCGGRVVKGRGEGDSVFGQRAALRLAEIASRKALGDARFEQEFASAPT